MLVPVGRAANEAVPAAKVGRRLGEAAVAADADAREEEIEKVAQAEERQVADAGAQKGTLKTGQDAGTVAVPGGGQGSEEQDDGDEGGAFHGIPPNR